MVKVRCKAEVVFEMFDKIIAFLVDYITRNISTSSGSTDDLQCFPISHQDKIKQTYTKLKFPISQSFGGEV